MQRKTKLEGSHKLPSLEAAERVKAFLDDADAEPGDAAAHLTQLRMDMAEVVEVLKERKAND